MNIHQAADKTGEFSYEISYLKESFGFRLTGINVERHGLKVFSKQTLSVFFKSEAMLLEHGASICASVADYITKSSIEKNNSR
ncbi:hypothetical protein [Herbaspirillum huttiense]|uniref:hypothetical protein n=1 Tax=Herbaspirillum huttiense TaxID=863372 RepID=UPI0031D365AD